MFTPKLRSL